MAKCLCRGAGGTDVALKNVRARGKARPCSNSGKALNIALQGANISAEAAPRRVLAYVVLAMLSSASFGNLPLSICASRARSLQYVVSAVTYSRLARICRSSARSNWKTPSCITLYCRSAASRSLCDWGTTVHATERPRAGDFGGVFDRAGNHS